MPIMLIHGADDRTVPLSVSKDLYDALCAHKAPCTLRVYPGAGHAGLLFDALAQPKPQLITDLVEFINACPPVADSG